MSNTAQAVGPGGGDSHGEHDGTRRDFLFVSASAFGVVGTAAALWPFVASMNPAADVLALSSIEVDLKPGRIVLFGLRPQHRAQTHATFPMLFNALYVSAEGAAPVSSQQQ